MSEIKAGGLYVDVGLSTANSVVLFLLLAFLVSSLGFELFFSIPYSKFATKEEIEKLSRVHIIKYAFHHRVNPRLGWALIYIFPVIVPAIAFAVYAVDNNEKIGKIAPSETYAILVFIGWILSFTKRFLESQFLQVYSDTIPILTILIVSGGYSYCGFASVYFANQVEGYEISPDSGTFVKDIICIVGYVVFISLNFHSHLTLRNIRKRNPEQPDKKYYSLHELGRLFVVLVCPHYIFEVVFWLFWAAFSGVVSNYISAGFSFFYLSIRTYKTYQWYVSKGLHTKPEELVEVAAFGV